MVRLRNAAIRRGDLAELREEDYEGATRALSKYATLKLIGELGAARGMMDAISIANLAALPIEASLNDWADIVSEAGFRYQANPPAQGSPRHH